MASDDPRPTTHARDAILGGIFVLAACRGSAPPEPLAIGSQAPANVPATPPAPAVPTATASSPNDAGAPPVVDAGEDAAPPAPPRVLAKGARVIAIEAGKVMARRTTGSAPALILGPAPRDTEAKLTATVTLFLKRPTLLDVSISELSEHGWHHQSRETHYVIDTSGAADVLACTFTGAASSGGEYSSESTSADVKPVTGNPRAFDVTRTTTSRASQPRGAPTASKPTTLVDHLELGTSSCTASAP